ncbi:MAG: phage holin family protein [Opitutaceae bacterium]|nr:phage holin family protein [Opitutaceae bacterium]
MNSQFLQLLLRWAVLALGVTIATKIVPGIECSDGTTLLVVVLLLSFFNAILKPLLVLFTLPFIVLTMGLGVVVINALLFLLVGHLVTGFHVASFWSAVGGALVVSVTNLILSLLMRGGGGPPAQRRDAPRPKKDDVIDI